MGQRGARKHEASLAVRFQERGKRLLLLDGGELTPILMFANHLHLLAHYL